MLQTFAVTDHADGDALDRHGVAPEVELDWLELWIFGQQLDRVTAPTKALDGYFIGESSNDNLATARFVPAVYCEQIPFKYSGVAHGHSTHPKEVVGARSEQSGIDLEAPLEVLLGE